MEFPPQAQYCVAASTTDILLETMTLRWVGGSISAQTPAGRRPPERTFRAAVLDRVWVASQALAHANVCSIAGAQPPS